MYELSICVYNNDEGEDLKTDFRVADTIGEFDTRREAEYVAVNLAVAYHNSGAVAAYCKAHEADGLCFDVVDRSTDNCVTSYELEPGGHFDEWRDFECHE